MDSGDIYKKAVWSFAELCEPSAVRPTKAQLAAEHARELSEKRAARIRAAKKGDRAMPLLRECVPDPAVVAEWVKDFERGAQGRG